MILLRILRVQRGPHVAATLEPGTQERRTRIQPDRRTPGPRRTCLATLMVVSSAVQWRNMPSRRLTLAPQQAERQVPAPATSWITSRHLSEAVLIALATCSGRRPERQRIRTRSSSTNRPGRCNRRVALTWHYKGEKDANENSDRGCCGSAVASRMHDPYGQQDFGSQAAT